MKITRFRKYISWNIASAIGYCCIVITFVFLFLLGIALSGTTIRPDINEYFYDYIFNHLVGPYISFYKFQLFLVAACLIASVYEHKHYINTGEYGLRLFGNHEKIYSIIFVTGLAFNFLPLYIFTIIIFSWIVKSL